MTVLMACLGVFVAYLPVTTRLGEPARHPAGSLHEHPQLAWVSDAFVLPMAAFILTAGVFGDVHGRKKVYLAGLRWRRGRRDLALARSRSGHSGPARRSPGWARPRCCRRRSR